MPKAKILVIDDEIGYRDWIRYELDSPEFEVVTAGGGREGLEILQKERIDVVVTDLKMPEMNGLETVAAIKGAFPAIPVILMTGHYDTLDYLVQQALELKAATCLRKPFDIGELRRAIQPVL